MLESLRTSAHSGSCVPFNGSIWRLRRGVDAVGGCLAQGSGTLGGRLAGTGDQESSGLSLFLRVQGRVTVKACWSMQDVGVVATGASTSP